ncbi:MAG: protein kinase [Myxococcota bacterium]|nr:protein kinase [Myxococcota bacterium]
MEPRRRFRFLKQLSEGTFGKVYMAEMVTDNNFSSVVAIKLLHGKWLGHQEIVQRSRDEARVLGLLHHRNIIRVEDLTSLNGQCAVIMEYLDGVDLKSLINYCAELGTTIPRRVCFELVAATASALEAAYYREPLRGGQPLNLIHRDIKPSNVMVTAAGDIKVLDFGTAQARFENREAQTQALAFGSQAYMAPERLLGDSDAPSGDIFSLGVTLYELLSLEAFGKIHIRPERYDESHTARMENLDFSDLDETLATKIREALNVLLKYEASERPDAREVLELMETLSDEIHDGSLRRFCREIVTPCRDRLVSGDGPIDPLAGSTLFEDISDINGEWLRKPESSSPEVASEVVDPAASEGFIDGSVHTSDPPIVVPEKPPASATMPFSGALDGPTVSDGLTVSRAPMAPSEPELRAVEPPSADASPLRGGLTHVPEMNFADPAAKTIIASPPKGRRSPPPADQFNNTISPSIGTPSKPAGPTTEVPSAASPKPSSQGKASGGGIGKWILLGLLGVLAVGGGVVVTVMKAIEPTESADPEVTPEVIAEPEVEGIDGQVIAIGSIGPDAGTVILTVDGAVQSVKLNASSGDYEEVWNGTGELELVGLPAGVYRTKIKSDSTARSTIESVPEKTCRYTFRVNQGASEWESDCD